MGSIPIGHPKIMSIKFKNLKTTVHLEDTNPFGVRHRGKTYEHLCMYNISFVKLLLDKQIIHVDQRFKDFFDTMYKDFLIEQQHRNKRRARLQRAQSYFVADYDYDDPIEWDSGIFH